MIAGSAPTGHERLPCRSLVGRVQTLQTVQMTWGKHSRWCMGLQTVRGGEMVSDNVQMHLLRTVVLYENNSNLIGYPVEGRLIKRALGNFSGRTYSRLPSRRSVRSPSRGRRPPASS